MKNVVKIFTLFLLLMCAHGVQGQDYQGSVVIKNSTLEERNDTLNMQMEVLVKKNSVMDYAAMRLLPKLVSEENKLIFPDILIQGTNERKTYNRWLKTRSRKQKEKYEAPGRLILANQSTDTLLVYNYRVPYVEWMDEAQLVVDQELIGYRDQRTLVVFAMDSRIKLSPRTPYIIQPYVNYIEPDNEAVKRRAKQGQAFLDFQVGKSVILPSYRRNPQELEKIRYAVDEIKTNSDVEIQGLYIEGYASPEGRYEINERLARDRAYALKNYMTSNYGLSLSDHQIKVDWVAEDWDGLRAQVEGSDFRYKDEVLYIIENESDMVRRKQKLQALAGGTPYHMMLQDLYPQLRRVEYQIDFSVRDFSVEETKRMIEINSRLVSHLELFRAAETYQQESREFENIVLDIAPQLFPNDAVAWINASAALISRGEYATAKRYLERYTDDSRAWNNLGVVYLMEGDYENAEKYLQLAHAQPQTATVSYYNLLELEAKQADDQKQERYKSR